MLWRRAVVGCKRQIPRGGGGEKNGSQEKALMDFETSGVVVPLRMIRPGER